MKEQIERLPPFDPKTGHVNVIVETPKDSRIKYSYDPDTGMFLLTKSMPAGMMYPYNFGFIPQTLGSDGDPLDMLVLNEEPLISGCLLKVNPVGVIKASQTEGKDQQPVRNDRIIGQAMTKEPPREFQPLKLEKFLISQLESFFSTYNKFYGKEFNVLGVGDPQEARELIEQGAQVLKKKQGHT